MGDYEMMMSEHENIMDRVWLNDIANEAERESFGSKLCEVIGDYHIIDPDNGLYEVWYVNRHDPHDDSLLSEHETYYEARMNAVCMVQADKILESGRLV
jgi:hypothetical protein